MNNNRHKHNGVFITLEGGEGAGKSSVLNQLASDLTTAGHLVVKTREPGGSHLGEQIRNLLLRHQKGPSMGARAELFLFLAARAQHVEELIQPALHLGKVVLCDRFHDSSIAYQGVARGLGKDQVEEFSLFSSQGLIPSCTLFFDVDPRIGLQRARHKGVGSLDRIEEESIAFHEKVRKAFLELAKSKDRHIHVIDGSLPLDQVYAEAKKHVMRVVSHAHL